MNSLLLKSTLILTSFLMLSFATTDLKVNDEKVVGTWKYSVPDAPEGYEKGELVIEEKAGKLVGHASIQGYKIPAEKMKLEGDKLTFQVYIEGTQVDFNLTFEKNKFKGKVSYSEGTIGISGTKQEE